MEGRDVPLAILMFSEKAEKRQSMTVLGKLKPGPSLSSFTTPSRLLSNAGWKADRAATRPRGVTQLCSRVWSPSLGRSIPEQGTLLHTVAPHGPAVAQPPDTKVGRHEPEDQA